MTPGLYLRQPLLTAAQLRTIAPKCAADIWAPVLEPALREFEIDSKIRIAAFFSQLLHESNGLTVVEENLNYTDPVRIVQVFRRFDLDRDRVADPEEVEFARGFVRQPVRLANYAYAKKVGNGDAASGDGWRYRGRGPIQITGKANYTTCGIALGLDLVGQPDLLLEPVYGARAAGWFWASRKLNAPADLGDIITVTKLVNGGTHGLKERLEHFHRARGALAAA